MTSLNLFSQDLVKLILEFFNNSELARISVSNASFSVAVRDLFIKRLKEAIADLQQLFPSSENIPEQPEQTTDPKQIFEQVSTQYRRLLLQHEETLSRPYLFLREANRSISLSDDQKNNLKRFAPHYCARDNKQAEETVVALYWENLYEAVCLFIKYGAVPKGPITYYGNTKTTLMHLFETSDDTRYKKLIPQLRAMGCQEEEQKEDQKIITKSPSRLKL